jgi:hypothetical protein
MYACVANKPSSVSNLSWFNRRVLANSQASDQRKELDAKKREARVLRDAVVTSEEKLARLTAKKAKLIEEQEALQERVDAVSAAKFSA